MGRFSEVQEELVGVLALVTVEHCNCLRAQKFVEKFTGIPPRLSIPHDAEVPGVMAHTESQSVEMHENMGPESLTARASGSTAAVKC